MCTLSQVCLIMRCIKIQIPNALMQVACSAGQTAASAGWGNADESQSLFSDMHLTVSVSGRKLCTCKRIYTHKRYAPNNG